MKSSTNSKLLFVRIQEDMDSERKIMTINPFQQLDASKVVRDPVVGNKSAQLYLGIQI